MYERVYQHALAMHRSLDGTTIFEVLPLCHVGNVVQSHMVGSFEALSAERIYDKLSQLRGVGFAL